MAVVIGADFQMFVLWKEAGDPFNPSLSSWGEDARVGGHGGHLKDEEQKQIISDDQLFPLRNGRRFDFFLFNASQRRLKAETLRRWLESDLRRPLRKEQTPGGKQCLTEPKQRAETME